MNKQIETGTPNIISVTIPVGNLVPNLDNPNRMSSRAFNLLVDNIRSTGFVEPLFVRPIAHGKYRIIGGHHRYDAALLLDYTELPCRVRDDAEFTDDEEAFQLMRMNSIRGKLDIEKFGQLYSKLSEKYTSEELVDAFGFEDDAVISKLVQSTKASLPKELVSGFVEGAKEVKSVQDLATLLSRLFATYGDTLPHGYMFLDFNGQDSVWIRMQKPDLEHVRALGDLCRSQNKSLDGVIRMLLQLTANGDLPNVTEAIKLLPDIHIPESFEGMPLEDLLGKLDG